MRDVDALQEQIERWWMVLRLRDNGKTYREIGNMLGVSTVRAQQLCQQALRRRECGWPSLQRMK